MTREKRDDSPSLRVIALPTGGMTLLLPNAAVGEIIPYQRPEPVQSRAPWLLGILDWREQLVPAISLSAAQDRKPIREVPKHACFAICFTPNGNPEVPYVGILSDHIPRFETLHPSDLKPIPPPKRPNPFAQDHLSYKDKPAMIPDFDIIERVLQTTLQ